MRCFAAAPQALRSLQEATHPFKLRECALPVQTTVCDCGSVGYRRKSAGKNQILLEPTPPPSLSPNHHLSKLFRPLVGKARARSLFELLLSAKSNAHLRDRKSQARCASVLHVRVRANVHRKGPTPVMRMTPNMSSRSQCTRQSALVSQPEASSAAARHPTGNQSGEQSQCLRIVEMECDASPCESNSNAHHAAKSVLQI